MPHPGNAQWGLQQPSLAGVPADSRMSFKIPFNPNHSVVLLLEREVTVISLEFQAQLLALLPSCLYSWPFQKFLCLRLPLSTVCKA